MTYVFVGCSGEVVDQANALSELVSDKLGEHTTVEVWHQPGVMETGSVLIQELEQKADEAEVMAIPVLWNDGPHSASIGVLSVSSANEELMTTYEPCVQRLQLVANVLGVAAAQLSRGLEAPGDDFVGIDVTADQDQRSFTRRAVAVRRAIAGQVIKDLVDRRAVSIEAVGDEFVLVTERERPTSGNDTGGGPGGMGAEGPPRQESASRSSDETVAAQPSR